MHEMALAESMLQIVEDTATTQGFSQVRVIWVEVGSMAGVEVSALQFCFEAVARNTIAQNARLEIIAIAGTGYCSNCQRSSPVQDLLDACPACGAYTMQITGGTELRIKELDVI
ncbi:hydrogenase maturation nickel metallochaperone HypA [Sulfuriferula sp. AH1]|uniref:hydrogenase maturation nickel metallochaperone HypA n=1 Tax=Sulfuriferula sp. AH1 TaxID=1985873 RepID=UPI000B3B16AC|nr:hydrogenase maturation nickel metallochaperone HypA [Sulfuriferula sp. AH1]ARU32220.1 hydrogenase maturation nickel metallochaperone HypA [Sulfuriferula sp. AH1]